MRISLKNKSGTTDGCRRPARCRHRGGTQAWLGALVLLAWLLAPSATSLSSAHGSGAGRDEWRRVRVGRVTREYLVHVPPAAIGPGRRTPRPLVVMLHGAGASALGMSRLTQMNRKADASDFIVVYPNGTPLLGKQGRTWNAGGCCGGAALSRVDDVAFIRAVLDDVARHHAVDTRRVYAAGLSNGAMMTYRLASELSDRFAAVAAVAGSMAQPTARPLRPVPILHMHGDADRVASFDGGLGAHSLARSAHRSVADTLDVWLGLNGCGSAPTVERLPDVVADGTTVRRQTYGPPPGTPAERGAPVVLYVIEGGGHNWPGRPPLDQLMGRRLQVGNLARLFVRFGASTRDVRANDVIWSFFQQHTLTEVQQTARASREH